jgi:hypothetical protein
MTPILSGLYRGATSHQPVRWSDAPDVAGTREAISAPAFGGSIQKISAELAATMPTSRNPGGKSAAMMVA